MKVFIGTVNIASQIPDWERGFKAIGCDTLTASIRNYAFMMEGDIDYNLSVDRFQSLRPHRITKYFKPYLNKLFGNQFEYVFKKALKECDLFVFIWDSLLPEFKDLEIIKANGKKIVFIYVGSDVRWKPAMEQDFTTFGMHPIEYEKYDYSEKGLIFNLRKLRNGELYADQTYNNPNQAQLALKPYNQYIIPLWTTDLQIGIQQRKDRPKVIHAPSNSFFKGTKYVIAAFEKLKQDGIQFEPILIHNMPYSDVKKLYSDCDILVGQLLCPPGGKQEREVLACNKVVLSSINLDYETNIPRECPIIDVNPDNVYRELKDILLNYEKRVDYAGRGRDYVLKYHNPEKLCQRIIDDAFTEEKTKKYDNYPDFFRHHFIPESEELIPVYNEWTAKIMKEDWYKKYVPAGERERLIF